MSSPFGVGSRRTNCPACAALAMSGDFTVISTMPPARSTFFRMVCGAWATIGVARGALDEVLDFRLGERNVADDLARRRLSVAGGENGGRAAAGRVAAGIDALERGLLRPGADVDRPPLGGLRDRVRYP